MSTTDDDLALPTTPLARSALAYASTAAGPSILNHSVRTYLYGRFAGRARGLDGQYDDELLFVASVLHDVGLVGGEHSSQRFEVDGADLAADHLRREGMSEDRVAIVWDAIALHTSIGIVDRKRPEIALVSAGAGLDLSVDLGAGRDDALPEAWAARVHVAHPRLDAAAVLRDAIVDQVRADPRKAPPFTLPAELFRQETGVAPPTWSELLADRRAEA